MIIALLAVLLVPPSSASPQSPGQSARPAIGGEWTLNRELSSTPRGGGPDPADRTPTPGGGRGGMRGGFGGPGFGGGSTRSERPDREEMERRRSLLREVLEAPTRFLITLEEPMVIFTYGDGRVVRYKADGKEERHQHPSGTVKTKAKWESGQLQIETNLGDGMKITHAYTVRPDSRQLVVTVITPGQSKDLPPVTHVYDWLDDGR
jgi:hypothetical protein